MNYPTTYTTNRPRFEAMTSNYDAARPYAVIENSTKRASYRTVGRYATMEQAKRRVRALTKRGA